MEQLFDNGRLGGGHRSWPPPAGRHDSPAIRLECYPHQQQLAPVTDPIAQAFAVSRDLWGEEMVNAQMQAQAAQAQLDARLQQAQHAAQAQQAEEQAWMQAQIQAQTQTEMQPCLLGTYPNFAIPLIKPGVSPSAVGAYLDMSLRGIQGLDLQPQLQPPQRTQVPVQQQAMASGALPVTMLNTRSTMLGNNNNNNDVAAAIQSKGKDAERRDLESRIRAKSKSISEHLEKKKNVHFRVTQPSDDVLDLISNAADHGHVCNDIDSCDDSYDDCDCSSTSGLSVLAEPHNSSLAAAEEVSAMNKPSANNALADKANASVKAKARASDNTSPSASTEHKEAAHSSLTAREIPIWPGGSGTVLVRLNAAARAKSLRYGKKDTDKPRMSPTTTYFTISAERMKQTTTNWRRLRCQSSAEIVYLTVNSLAELMGVHWMLHALHETGSWEGDRENGHGDMGETAGAGAGSVSPSSLTVQVDTPTELPARVLAYVAMYGLHFGALKSAKVTPLPTRHQPTTAAARAVIGSARPGSSGNHLAARCRTWLRAIADRPENHRALDDARNPFEDWPYLLYTAGIVGDQHVFGLCLRSILQRCSTAPGESYFLDTEGRVLQLDDMPAAMRTVVGKDLDSLRTMRERATDLVVKASLAAFRSA